jgi:hypothetical protein
MWEPRRLTTLWDSTACYRDSFAFTEYPSLWRRFDTSNVTFHYDRLKAYLLLSVVSGSLEGYLGVCTLQASFGAVRQTGKLLPVAALAMVGKYNHEIIPISQQTHLCKSGVWARCPLTCFIMKLYKNILCALSVSYNILIYKFQNTRGSWIS